MLSFSENFFLLSLVDKKNIVAPNNTMAFDFALAGAILLELLSNQRVSIDLEGLVRVVDPSSMSEEWMNSFLKELITANRSYKVIRWINVWSARRNNIEKILLKNLLDKGILSTEEKHYLWIIPHREYSDLDTSVKQLCKEHLRAVVFTYAEVNQESIALLSLLHAADLLNHLFTPDEIKTEKQRIDDLIKGEVVGQAVLDALDEMTLIATSAAMMASSV